MRWIKALLLSIGIMVFIIVLAYFMIVDNFERMVS
jgi:hypothetical protein